MLELLSPAGSPEGVAAAVQNGADAVYMGFGDFNARRNARNFSEEDIARAAEYCRIRGVKTYVTLNTLASDRELGTVAEMAKRASRAGVDAILIQDLGVLRVIREAVPEMTVHGSTQMTIHNLEGVRLAAAMGISRVVLARELTMTEIKHICDSSPIEIEVFGHGALCMCYSGQCYMSAVIGRRSGNRGLCAQPCRLEYSTAALKCDHPLSLKDNCLIGHLKELEDCGVKCLKIEGRMRRPEYTAIVTGIYSKAIHEGLSPTREDMETLQKAFSRQGFTDGYFTGKKGRGMFGVRTEDDKQEFPVFSTARKNYMNGEVQRVPVRFAAVVRHGEAAKIAASDDRGNVAAAEGPVPEAAFSKPLTQGTMETQLGKTGGTPFKFIGAKCQIEDDMSLPVSAINEMRRKVLAELFEKRKYMAPRREGIVTPVMPTPNRSERPVMTVSVMKAAQLSHQMLTFSPGVLYFPLMETESAENALRPFIDSEETEVAVTLPRIIHDGELPQVRSLMKAAADMGIKTALVGNLGQIMFAREQGFSVRGDFGLNIFNAQALAAAQSLGLESATLSFELRMEQVKAMSKILDTELIVYGRLPLMITENCVVKNAAGVCTCENSAGITDRSGFRFPVVKEMGCRNVILNSKKLFLADKTEDYEQAGLWGARFQFTTENALECVSVLDRYAGNNDYAPSAFTRGLYYRGVE